VPRNDRNDGNRDVASHGLRSLLAVGRLVGDTLYGVRYYLLLATMLFVGGFTAALCIYSPVVGTAAAGSGNAGGTASLTALDIAVNNVLVAVTLCSGWVLLGMPTVAGLVFNGYLLGRIATELVALGNDPVTVMLYVLPHGLLEIPGLLLSATVGLVPPVRFAQYIRGRRSTVVSRSEARSLILIVSLSLTLIVVAAAVEAWITGPLAEAITRMLPR